MRLPEEYLQRMQALLGEAYPAFLRGYENAPVRALRVNTQKITPEGFLARAPWPLSPGPLTESFILEEGRPAAVDSPGNMALGSHPYHHAGLFYVQEPTAMAPIEALDIRPGMRVLDLCAAPGGKATGIAARLGGRGLLVANEIVPGRAKTLVWNLQRMGVANAAATCAAPEAVAAALPGWFDAVLLDAPCSGEGMFRKDPEAVLAWSPAHVRACAARQAGILRAAADCLRAGGRLVYSTCTFSPEENEQSVQAFLAARPDYSLLDMRRLYPHQVRGEGHFVVVLQRTDGTDAPAQADFPVRRADVKPYAAFAREHFRRPLPGVPCPLPDGRLFLLPAGLPAGLRALALRMAGVEAGELLRGRFEPAHALYLAHGTDCVQTLSFAPEDAALASFLHGEPLPAPASLRGYAAVCVETWPLGFGKAGGGTLKNRLPKGLRSFVGNLS